MSHWKKKRPLLYMSILIINQYFHFTHSLKIDTMHSVFVMDSVHELLAIEDHKETTGMYEVNKKEMLDCNICYEINKQCHMIESKEERYSVKKREENRGKKIKEKQQQGEERKLHGRLNHRMVIHPVTM